MKSSHSLRELSQNSILISFLLLRPALIHVIPVLALRAAELIARTVGDEDLCTVFAQPEGILRVSEHEAEHQLNPEKEGVKIPDDGRLVEKCDVIARRVSVKSRHALPVQLTGIFAVDFEALIIWEAKGEEDSLCILFLFNRICSYTRNQSDSF